MEEKQPEEQSFYVVIPTLLLEDEGISLKAKRVYALISSLCKKEGYCWASNKFLAKTLKMPLSTVRFSLKKLEEKKWIKSEVNKEEGNSRRIFLNMPDFYHTYANKLAEGYANAPEQKKQRYANAPEQKIPNNNIDNNKHITILKDIGKQVSYGNPDINSLMDFLKEKLGGSPDGTIKENRRYAYLLLKRIKKDYPQRDSVSIIKFLIQAGLQDNFHGKNLTSFKYLYKNAQKIIQTIKGRLKNPKYIKLD